MRRPFRTGNMLISYDGRWLVEKLELT